MPLPLEMQWKIYNALKKATDGWGISGDPSPDGRDEAIEFTATTVDYEILARELGLVDSPDA